MKANKPLVLKVILRGTEYPLRIRIIRYGYGLWVQIIMINKREMGINGYTYSRKRRSIALIITHWVKIIITHPV